MRSNKPTPTRLHELGAGIARLADTLTGCVARSLTLGSPPPLAVTNAELALWRWAHALTRAELPPPPRRAGYLTSVVFLVDIDDPELDRATLITAMLRTTAHSGTVHVPDQTDARKLRAVAWRIRHITARDLPAATVSDGGPVSFWAEGADQ